MDAPLEVTGSGIEENQTTSLEYSNFNVFTIVEVVAFCRYYYFGNIDPARKTE